MLQKFLIDNRFLKCLSILVVVITTAALISCGREDDDTTKILLLLSMLPQVISDGGVLQGEYNGGVVVVEDATITLRGTVKFNLGSSLTINPGVTVKADTSTLSYLIIDRGAKIYAQGTAAKPITFTSGNAVGSRSASDWGGIVINGYATINSGITAEGEGDSGTYGGANDNDNSGVIQYVRIQFAGYAFSPTNELNGLCLQAVGDQTTVDYVQIHNGKDDGIEMFGGTVNIKHIIASGNQDDQIDCTFGWRGKVQFAIAINAGVGDSGLEHDGNEDNNTATPRTDVTYYNLTVLGKTDKRGARLRRGTIAKIYNSYFTNTQAARGIYLEDTASTATVGNSSFELCGDPAHTVVAGTWNDAGNIDIDNAVAPAATYINAQNTDTLAELETNSADALDPDNSDPVGTHATPPDDGFYDITATFTGAIKLGGPNWASGWTEFPDN